MTNDNHLAICVRNVVADGKHPDYLAVAMLLDCLESAGDSRRDKVLEFVGDAANDMTQIGAPSAMMVPVNEGGWRAGVSSPMTRNHNRCRINETFLLRMRLLFWLELEGTDALRRLQEATKMEAEAATSPVKPVESAEPFDDPHCVACGLALPDSAIEAGLDVCWCCRHDSLRDQGAI